MQVSPRTAQALALASLLAIGGSAALPQQANGEPTIIVTADGKYYYSGGGGTAVLVENVIRLPGAPGPDPGPGPDPDPQPPTRVSRVEQLSRSVDDENGAMVFATATKAIADTLNAGESITESLWNSSTGIVLAGLTEKKTAWTQWVRDVGALANGSYSKSFFQDVSAGLRRAYDLDQSLIDAAVAEAAGEATAEQQAALEEAAFNWEAILAIIRLIINLIQTWQNLGVR